MNLRVDSGKDSIRIEINPPAWEAPQAVKLVIRSPKNQPLGRVTIDGQTAEIAGDSVTLFGKWGTVKVIAYCAAK